MCILFLYYNPLHNNEDGYEVVVASNRDEYYARPTKSLSAWGSEMYAVASGIDLQPGRQGGAWLGVSETGRLASLLNIYSDIAPNPNMKGRGFLVPNYLRSTVSMPDYVKQISNDSYEGFRLLLAERLPEQGWRISTYSNKSGLTEQHGPGFYAFSNNLDSSLPFMKASYGRERFKDIIAKHGAAAEQRTALVDSLMHLLTDETRCLPQSEADRQTFTLHSYPHFSSIKVVSPIGDYGTRTSSVILIDGRGLCEFIESTRPDDGSSPWTTSSVRLQMRGAS